MTRYLAPLLLLAACATPPAPLPALAPRDPVAAAGSPSLLYGAARDWQADPLHGTVTLPEGDLDALLLLLSDLDHERAELRARAGRLEARLAAEAAVRERAPGERWRTILRGAP